ncbi:MULTISPECIES: LON peptidase substrate-binding domain-containing protein [Pseudomonas]|uniref:ATP-dependent protease n=1 Tax=Pseudomonas quercus TaxID=2722792 RepID=A0ABX0YGH6_9PSED|nr:MULTISPECIES: LON peptidase substrate-binding domain-containing protein [Pseudomonas]MBF7143996.1 LON peptidase substrate-binding domain-containing protein [Pseudomonas sp. LY10J]NJP02536.1 ATP-dependent protease [Pseudomonas quercus]
MTLPLFPLNTVLFPGCKLDLQLFEARYLDMIGRCMKQGEGFGIVCIVQGSEVGEAATAHATLGCEARVLDFQQQDNGLLGIRIEGGRRFQVERVEVQRDQLIVADVNWLEEAPEVPVQDEDEDLLVLLAALTDHPMVAGLGMGGPPLGRQALANRLAYLLPFDDGDKLALLGIAEPGARLAALQALLERMQGELQA